MVAAMRFAEFMCCLYALISSLTVTSAPSRYARVQHEAASPASADDRSSSSSSSALRTDVAAAAASPSPSHFGRIALAVSSLWSRSAHYAPVAASSAHASPNHRPSDPFYQHSVMDMFRSEDMKYVAITMTNDSAQSTVKEIGKMNKLHVIDVRQTHADTSAIRNHSCD